MPHKKHIPVQLCKRFFLFSPDIVKFRNNLIQIPAYFFH